MSQFVAYVDGSSHGNPGPSGIGVIVEDPNGNQIRIAKWIGWQDNNVAEYVALMEALQCAVARRARSLIVYSDSDVVVRQMSGEYACRSPRLYSLHWICRKLARSLEFVITRIPRERNREANRLANTAARMCRNSSLQPMRSESLEYSSTEWTPEESVGSTYASASLSTSASGSD